MTPLFTGLRRFLRYNLVGAMGLGVKFSVLTALVELSGVGYLASTAVAVEAAMMHNFIWHQRWTWRDRSTRSSHRETLMRLVRFQLGIGAVAMLANLLVTRLLVQELAVHYVAANLAATVFAGLANFMVSNFVVFVAAERPVSHRV
jgi:putative flippase GtrA